MPQCWPLPLALLVRLPRFLDFKQHSLIHVASNLQPRPMSPWTGLIPESEILSGSSLCHWKPREPKGTLLSLGHQELKSHSSTQSLPTWVSADIIPLQSSSNWELRASKAPRRHVTPTSFKKITILWHENLFTVDFWQWGGITNMLTHSDNSHTLVQVSRQSCSCWIENYVKLIRGILIISS